MIIFVTIWRSAWSFNVPDPSCTNLQHFAKIFEQHILYRVIVRQVEKCYWLVVTSSRRGPSPPPLPPCLRVIAVVYSHFRGFHEARACWLLAWVATLCANRISWENNNYPTIATGLMAHTFTLCYKYYSKENWPSSFLAVSTRAWWACCWLSLAVSILF